jgi:hypothetical protein
MLLLLMVKLQHNTPPTKPNKLPLLPLISSNREVYLN